MAVDAILPGQGDRLRTCCRQQWRMPGVSSRAPRLVSIALLCVFWANLTRAQQILPPEIVPSNFTADAEFAAWVRSVLLPSTQPATGQYAVGRQAMETLLQQLPAERAKFSWDLRIAAGAGNVFSSPDGTIFVDQELAQMMGTRAGLWAAALAHEISHVVRRDWARRYLFRKSLEKAGASQITLGDAGVFSGSWLDARAASNQFASFCQSMELEADADGLMLMTRAGFDPDFVPALHHLLEAQPQPSDADPFHPGWDEREHRLQKLYVAAGKEYDNLWPDRYASPGGNSPIVVYAGSPSAKLGATGELEVMIPLHCLNLVGSVEVVLRFAAPNFGSATELHEFTGCTSDRTLLTFTLPSPKVHIGGQVQAEISVLDDTGSLLTRLLAPLRVR